MDKFQLLATPWPVNLLILVPILSFYFWRRKRLELSRPQLLWTGLFGIAFGLVESSVIVYLRAALGFLPNFGISLTTAANVYQQPELLAHLPRTLLSVEFFRESATIVMLLTIALLAAKSKRERLAVFLWTFAFWDIFYYVWLWIIVRWPGSLTTPDVLFLIPVPWLSQVWFPIVVSGLTLFAIWMNRKQNFHEE